MEEDEEDLIGEIDLGSLLIELESPDFGTLLENSNTEKVVTPSPQPLSTPSPDEDTAGSSSISEIEKVLMENNYHFDDNSQTKSFSDGFLADMLVDSPPSGGGDVIDNHSDAAAEVALADAHVTFREQEFTHGDDNDPLDKKLRRQLRNRDAAVKSRERKKKYVMDLEMKSRYLEGECRRLGRMLQCFIAENQALRLTLQKGCAFDASSAKQESAVLLLESLLLGSLLWFLGIMCLFGLPPTPPMALLARVSVESKDERSPGRADPRGPGSSSAGQSYVMMRRRCKASRVRMKGFHVLATCSSILGLIILGLGPGKHIYNTTWVGLY